ncbi:hypothetical protein JST97_13820 [bacterium]|nr:hypothetical protein [bacterium]
MLFLLAFVFCLVAMLLFWPTRPHLGPEFLLLSQLLALLSWGIYALARNLDNFVRSRGDFVCFCLLAALMRAALAWGPGLNFPLSSDIYRYVWDGRMISEGVSPYLYPPDAKELEALRLPGLTDRINHPDLCTIYPPLAQDFFFLSYWLGGGAIWAFKVMSAIFEGLTIVALFRLLDLGEFPRSRILLWLFSPLVLIEFSFSAHLDMLAMPFLVTSLCCIEKEMPGRCGFLIACAVLIKFLGLLFVPYLFLHWRGAQRKRFLLSFSLALILIYLPFVLSAGGGVLGSLPVFLARWEFNASLYSVARYWLGPAVARPAAGLLLVLWLLLQALRKAELNEKLLWAFTGYVMLTTTLMPWYLIWMYPMLMRSPRAPLLWISGAVLLSYHGHYWIRMEGWPGGNALICGIYIPFYTLLLLSGRRPLASLPGPGEFSGRRSGVIRR